MGEQQAVEPVVCSARCTQKGHVLIRASAAWGVLVPGLLVMTVQEGHCTPQLQVQ